MALSNEFKNQVVSRILSNELSISAAHREYGIGKSTAHNWVKQVKAGVSNNTNLRAKEHKQEIPLPRGMNRVRGGGIKVIPNEEAILAAQKDFGIFVILSNLHASPWDVLRRYRRRNDIETSYRVVKSDLDGRKPRVWTMTSVRGKEICRHVALGYRFVLQSMMERTAQEAERRANDESLGKTVRKQYEKLAAWIRSMTLKQLLDWFDCVERVEERNRVAQYRWSTETTSRDQMFLELFFGESDRV